MPLDDRRIEISPDRRIGNPRPVGRSLPLVPASGNGVVSDVRTRIVFGQRPPSDDTLDPPPFFPSAIEDLGGSYRVTLTPGVVATWEPKTGSDTLEFFEPEVSGTPISATPAPTITVSSGEWVCMAIEVDGRNQIKEAPKVETGEEDGTHYIPRVADTEAQDGNYKVKLFRLTEVDGVISIERGVQSDIILTPYLWTGINEGGGIGRCLWKYDPETAEYKFRTFNTGYGVEIKEREAVIEPWFLAENVGTGVDFYVEPEDPQPFDPAEFRRLSGRSSGDASGATRQIDVRRNPDDPESNQVVGNSNVASLVFTRNGSEVGRLSWDDGLVTSGSDITIELCCDSSTDAPGP